MMFDLFGSGMPLAARFFIAFLVVLALIGVTAWLVRRFAANRLGSNAARGRQPRLAVIDAANVDGRRRLLLIRRDNVEHLLMVGGPTDIVVEPNIVRAAAAREVTREPRVGAGPETVTRPAPVAEGGWPLQPLPEPAPVAPARPYRAGVMEEPWLAPEPGAKPRPPESLGAFPPDLAPPVPRSEPPPPRVSAAPPPILPPEPPAAPAQTDHNLAEMALQLEAALRRAPMPEGRPPVTDPLAAQAATPAPKPPKPPEPAARPPLREFKPRAEPRVEPRFEAKPEAKAEPKFEPKPEPKFEARPKPEIKPEPKPETRTEPKLEPKPEPKPESKAAGQPEPTPPPDKGQDKSPYDNLEEEMATLLGRPSTKP